MERLAKRPRPDSGDTVPVETSANGQTTQPLLPIERLSTVLKVLKPEDVTNLLCSAAQEHPDVWEAMVETHNTRLDEKRQQIKNQQERRERRKREEDEKVGEIEVHRHAIEALLRSKNSFQERGQINNHIRRDIKGRIQHLVKGYIKSIMRELGRDAYKSTLLKALKELLQISNSYVRLGYGGIQDLDEYLVPDFMLKLTTFLSFDERRALFNGQDNSWPDFQRDFERFGSLANKWDNIEDVVFFEGLMHRMEQGILWEGSDSDEDEWPHEIEVGRLATESEEEM